MAVTLTLTDAEVAPGGITCFGTVAFSGNYPAGGDAVDLTSLFGKQGVQGVGPASTQQPVTFYVMSQNGGYGTSSAAGLGGYYVPVKGTALNNWKLQLFDAGGTERATAAYPAGVTADKVFFEIRFRQNQ